jgi:hypothetical protein
MSVHRLKRKIPTAPLEGALDCTVVAVLDDGGVDVELACGESLSVRCPLHIPIEWLRAARVIAPVEAVMVRSAGVRPILLAVAPDARHRSVRAQVHISASTMTIDASEVVEIVSGKSSVSLKQDGDVVVRGRDVLSRASEVNRLKGGRVRIN